MFESLLRSNDHGYVLLNVADHFWVKGLICPYTFLSDQNSSLHQICQCFCVPRIIRSLTGSSGALCSDGFGTRRMIRPYTGSSGPRRPPICRPVPAPAPLSLLSFFHRRRLLLLPLCARRSRDLTVGFRCGWTLWIPLASETPFPSISPPEFLDLRGKLKGNSFKTPVARSLNVESSSSIPLGDSILVLSRTHA